MSIPKLQSEPVDRLSAHFLAFLQEHGFSQQESERLLTIVSEAASALSQQFDGKIQKYLRKYGELMLKEVPALFHFTTINSDQIGHAFTYWFQNVLNMPLSLVDSNIVAFCQDNGFEVANLIAAADRLDVNLALLDDLVYLKLKTQEADLARA